MAAIDGSENIREREKIVKEIAKTSDSIRKKLRALKTGKIEKDIELDTHFKPLIEPLKKIVDNSSLIAVKKEEPESVADAGMEGDAAPKRKKRKRLSSWSGRFGSTPLKFLKSKRSKVAPPITSTPITSTPSATPRTVQPTVSELPASDDVFESMDTSNLATSVREQLQTPEGRETFLEASREYLGPLSRKYIGAVLSDDRKIDTVYGVHFGDDGMMLGNKRFDVDNADNIVIDDVRYIGTPGLYELIFKRNPDNDIYTEDDKQKYKSILLATSAHKRNHNAQAPLLSNRGYKYKYVIAPLLPIESWKKKSGQGLSMPRAMTLTENKIDYVHWDDPNELVDRLRLLDASRHAGNDAHDNEILSIIEELREDGLIIN